METEKKTLVVFPVGTLNEATKAELAANGFLGIESRHPHDVVTVLPVADLLLGGGEVTQALIDVVKENDERAKSFGRRILAALRVSQ